MSTYCFKLKKRKKYSNLEKKIFFFNKIYNTKIVKSSIIYKSWINNITKHFIKNGNKKTIYKKIKNELIKIYNQINSQKKLLWIIVLNESHQRSDFLTSSFKKKFSNYKKKHYVIKKNKYTNSLKKKNIDSIYEYEKKKFIDNKKMNWYKNFYFSKIISFFISYQTFFWFIKAFKIFKKKKIFIKKNWKFCKNFFYKYSIQKNINFKNNFKNKKSYFFNNKIYIIKFYKKKIFINSFSNFSIFNFIIKKNINNFFQNKKYFFNTFSLYSKKNKYKMINNNFFFWWYFSTKQYSSITKTNIVKKKNENKKKIYKKWLIIKKKNIFFNFIFEKNIKFNQWKKFFKKHILLKKNKIMYNSIFDKKKKKYYFSISKKKNFVFYKIKEINLQNEGKFLIIERNYSKTNFNNMYYDLIDLIAPFFKVIEQQKKTKKTMYIKYVKKRNSNFFERQKTFFSWIKEFIVKNNKYNNLIRNTSKPKKKNKTIKKKKSNRVILPFSSRFFTEFSKIFYLEGEIFAKLNEMDKKVYSTKTKKHFRWKL